MARIEPPKPLRPALPITLFVFTGLWAGVALSIQTWIVRFCLLSPAVPSTSGAISSVVLILVLCMLAGVVMARFASLRIPLIVLAIGCLVGVSAGTLCVVSLDSRIARLSLMPREAVIVRACEDAVETRFGTIQTAVIASGSGRGIRIQLAYGEQTLPLELGERATIDALVLPLVHKEASRILLSKGVLGQATVTRLKDRHYEGALSSIYRYRAHLAQEIASIGEDSAITRGILLGDRRGLSKEHKEQFARAGLSHVLAVSGAHFAVLCAGVLALLERAHLQRSISQLLAIAICSGYVVLTGASASAIRALGMLVVYSASMWLYRRSSPLNSLSLIGIVCLLVSPLWAISLGFGLSVLAVVGISLFARWGTWAIGALVPILPDATKASVALALVALLATAPLTSAQFGYVSLVAPITNSVITPLIMMTLSLALVGAAVDFFNPTIARALFSGCAMVNRLLVKGVTYCANLPWSTAPLSGGWVPILMIGIGALALWWFWPTPTRAVMKRWGRIASTAAALTLCASLLITSGLVTGGGEQIVVLDVGQGDATLIRSNDRALLIDAGPDPDILASRLRTMGIQQVDALVLTHDHEDHIAGATALLKGYGLRSVMCADGALSSHGIQRIATQAGIQPHCLKVGDTITWESFSLTVLGPRWPVTDPSANESSLILTITAKPPASLAWYRQMWRRMPVSSVLSATEVLVCGDAEAFTVKQALEYSLHQQTALPVFKIGHHGSAASADQELIAMVAPSAVVISVGARNEYGHPDERVIKLCRDAHSQVLRTDIEGSIVIELGP